LSVGKTGKGDYPPTWRQHFRLEIYIMGYKKVTLEVLKEKLKAKEYETPTAARRAPAKKAPVKKVPAKKKAPAKKAAAKKAALWLRRRLL